MAFDIVVATAVLVIVAFSARIDIVVVADIIVAKIFLHFALALTLG